MNANAPAWLRIVAIIGLLWNLVGLFFYLVHVGIVPGPEATEAERAFSDSFPAWATALWAIGVLAGALGTLGLLMRRSWAAPLLLLSFVALLIEQGWILLVSDAPRIAPSSVGLGAVIIVTSALLAWLGRHAKAKGWLA